MTVAGMSPLAMMSMHEQYPWMKEKKSSRKQQIQGRKDSPRLSKLYGDHLNLNLLKVL